jgi:hypothetical protein
MAFTAYRAVVEVSHVAHLVHRIERGHFVGLGQGWLVEDRIDEVLHSAATADDCLSDVDELGRSRAEDVDAEQAWSLTGSRRARANAFVTAR